MENSLDRRHGSASRARLICLVIGTIGSLLFAGMLTMLQLSPEKIGEIAESFIVEEVEDRVARFLPDRSALTPEGSAKERLLQAADGYLDYRLERIDTFVESGGPSYVASVLAAAGVTSCRCQAESEERVTTFLAGASASVRASLVLVQAEIVEQYDVVKQKLLTDLMIFISCNLVAFLLVVALAIFKGKAAKHLLPFAAVLSGAIFFSIYWYLFQQNWVFTVLFNDYWGISYAALMAAIFAFFADIALNRAKLTTFALNGISSVFGSVPLPIC